jgi:hypothetical protein
LAGIVEATCDTAEWAVINALAAVAGAAVVAGKAVVAVAFPAVVVELHALAPRATMTPTHIPNIEFRDRVQLRATEISPIHWPGKKPDRSQRIDIRPITQSGLPTDACQDLAVTWVATAPTMWSP